MDTQPGFSGLDGYPAHLRFSGVSRLEWKRYYDDYGYVSKERCTECT
jgi:hypothetical protein